MEKTVRIIREYDYKEQPYRDGSEQMFSTKGFLMTDGIDTFYAEMKGNLAKVNRDVHPDTSILHGVQLRITTHESTDSKGITRYNNEMQIVKLS